MKQKYRIGQRAFVVYDPRWLNDDADPIIEVEIIAVTIKRYKDKIDSIEYECLLVDSLDNPQTEDQEHLFTTRKEANVKAKKLLEMRINELERRLKFYKELHERKLN